MSEVASSLIQQACTEKFPTSVKSRSASTADSTSAGNSKRTGDFAVPIGPGGRDIPRSLAEIFGAPLTSDQLRNVVIEGRVTEDGRFEGTVLNRNPGLDLVQIDIEVAAVNSAGAHVRVYRAEGRARETIKKISIPVTTMGEGTTYSTKLVAALRFDQNK